jgi:drug/metabolite transporter (DMT)-like permease
MVEKAGSTEAASMGFLIPLFGILGGALLLHEPINWSTWTGMVLILLSVALVNRLQLGLRRAVA